MKHLTLDLECDWRLISAARVMKTKAHRGASCPVDEFIQPRETTFHSQFSIISNSEVIVLKITLNLYSYHCCMFFDEMSSCDPRCPSAARHRWRCDDNGSWFSPPIFMWAPDGTEFPVTSLVWQMPSPVNPFRCLATDHFYSVTSLKYACNLSPCAEEKKASIKNLGLEIL